MAIYIGNSELTPFYIGDKEVNAAYIGNTVFYTSNSAPTANVLSSNSATQVNGNTNVTFTSIVTDDNLTDGIYVFTVDGVAQAPQTHPNNTFALTGDGVTRTISCVFTDAGGLAIGSNTLSTQWLGLRANAWATSSTSTTVGGQSVTNVFSWSGGGTARICYSGPQDIGVTFGNQGGTGLPSNGDFYGAASGACNGVVGGVGYTSGGHIDNFHTGTAGTYSVTIMLPASGGFGSASFTYSTTAS